VRNIRAENNILPNKSIWLKIFAKWKSLSIVEQNLTIIAWIVKSDNFELVPKRLDSREFVFWIINPSLEVYVDTSNALDLEKEEERLKAQILDVKEYIAILDIKLLNDSFVLKAPEKLVRAEMEKKEQAIEKLKKLEDKLWSLKS
jgi:valyl-tRNA synthetase